MGLLVSIANQKGGVGKSTLTNVLANYLFSNTKYSVIVVDGDYLQESLTGLRNDELRKFLGGMKIMAQANGIHYTDEVKAVYEKEFIDKCYPIVTRDPETITQSLVDFRDKYDVVLVDLPGNLAAEGVVGVYVTFDLVIVPTDLTFKDLDSTRRFLNMYDTRVRPIRTYSKLPCNLYGVFNKVKVNTLEFKNRQEKIEDHNLKIPFMKSYITETNRLKRDDSSVEMISLEGLKNDKMVENFCKEVIDLMKKISQ
jgi:chromosome partitioning protein